MANPERFGTFYPIWPILDGKALSFQWGEIRSNQAEAKALVRNSFQELEDGVDELNAQRALLGQAFGDLVFSKKYRFFYNKVTFELCCQRNTGTVIAPIWVDAWCVRFSDGQFQAVGEGGINSAAGFYGPGLQSIEEVAESGASADVSIRNPTKIFFNADDGFGVQPIASGANAGQPEIRFTQPFGRAQAFPKVGRVWQVDHDFGITPVMVQIMDEDDRVVIPDVADVSDPNTAWFYFNAVFAGTAYIASGGVGATTLLPRDPFYLVVRTDEQSPDTHLLKPNADLIFDSRFFYVNVDLDPAHGGAHKSAFISLQAGGGGTTDHGALSGLLDDDHPQYARKAAGQNTFAGVITAEAFYLEGGGEFSTSGNDVLIKAVGPGHVNVDDDLIVTHRVVAEGFYLQTDTGLFSGPNIYLDDDGFMRIDGDGHPIIINKSGTDVVVGNPGSEGATINIAGQSQAASLKVSQIGMIGDNPNTQDIASLHLHRHSTTLAPGIIASRAKSDTASHSNVENNDELFRLYGTGRVGSTYEVAARMDIVVEGTPATDKLPGKIVFRTNPGDIDYGASPPVAATIHSDGHVGLENTLLVENAVTAEAFYLKTGGELITGIDVSRGAQLFENEVEINFNPQHFYVTTNSRGAPSISLIETATPAYRQTFSSSVEWQVQHNLGTVPVLWNVFDTGFSAFIPEKVDVSNPNIAYFYFTSSVAGTAIVAGGASTGSLVTFRESDNTPPPLVSNELVFNTENFYLDTTSQGKPQVNLRPRIYGQVGAFTKQQFFVPPNMVISGGNIAWNLDDAQVGVLNLSASATLQNPTNIRTGGQYTLIVTQAASNTLSFGTAYKFGDAGAPTLSTVAGRRDVLVFTGYGSEMFLVGVSTGF